MAHLFVYVNTYFYVFLGKTLLLPRQVHTILCVDRGWLHCRVAAGAQALPSGPDGTVACWRSLCNSDRMTNTAQDRTTVFQTM